MSAPTGTESLQKAAVALRRVTEKLQRLERERSEPIAIVGMGCRLPGGASDLQQLQQLLQEQRDAISPMPASRAERTSPSKLPWGGWLEDVDGFDAEFFGISPREAIAIDPQQRLLLEVAWEALDDAGIPPTELAQSRTGVFIGICTRDYDRLMQEHGCGVEQGMYAATGNGASFAAGRISYLLGLRGPSFAVDTACSSSLVAVHLACQSLRRGECDVALVGGVSLILSDATSDALIASQALAPDGRCKSFDAAANGFVRSEGCGVVVLTRMSDTQPGRYRVRAQIRGSAINQDGKSSGLTAPNPIAQEAVLGEALAAAGVDASAVGYVETHGTGTSLGDPIEYEALKAVLGKPRADGTPCVLGALKGNLGHLEAAAGVAGLIKAALCLESETIPGNLHFRQLNPRMSLEGTPFVISREATAWPRAGKARIAGVSSFGMSGTNAHVILEDAPRVDASGTGMGTDEDASAVQVLAVSGRSAEALQVQAERYVAALGELRDEDVRDFCYTANARRSHYAHRLSVVGKGATELTEQLRGRLRRGLERKPRSGDKVAFVFPGHGSQWEGMGRELMRSTRLPEFGRKLKEVDEAIGAYAGWSVMAELRGEGSGGLQREQNEYVQPALFAMSASVSAQLKSFGVEPDAVVGHSMGEIAAAHVSGALSLEAAVQVVCGRSEVLKRVVGQGGMALVELTLDEARAAVKGYEGEVSVAVNNSPGYTVLSGGTEALGRLVTALNRRGVFTRYVKVDYASHSPQMDELHAALEEKLRGVTARAGEIPVYSTLLGEVVDGSCMDGGYWIRNLREPVLFCGAVQQLLAAGHGYFVEQSAHPLLVPSVDEIGLKSGAGCVAVGSLRRNESEEASLLRTVSELYEQGYEVPWKSVQRSGRVVAVPSYPWQRQRHWVERAPTASQPSAARAMRSASAGLLGESIDLSSQPGMRLWELTLDATRLEGHRVGGELVVAAAMYLELCVAAGRARYGERCRGVLDVKLERALGLPEHAQVRVQVSVSQEQGGRSRVEVSSQREGSEGWTRHACGQLELGDAPRTAAPVPSDEGLGAEQPADSFYAQLEAAGLTYGGGYRGVTGVKRGDNCALGRIELGDEVWSEQASGSYVLHPCAVDSCLQVLSAIEQDEQRGTRVPVEIGSYRVYGSASRRLSSRARIVPANGTRESTAEVEIFDEHGACVAELRGIRAKWVEQQSAGVEAEEWLYHLGWEPSEPATEQGSIDGDVIALVGRWSGSRALGEALERAGAEVVCVERGAALVDALQGRPVKRVVYLGALGKQGAHWWDEARSVSEEVLELSQGLLRLELREPPCLYWTTRASQAVLGERVGEVSASGVSQSAVWGFARTLMLEHPELSQRLVELDAVDDAGLVQSLCGELGQSDAEEQVAYRQGARYVARLVHGRQAQASAGPERLESSAGRPYRLGSAKVGTLAALRYELHPRRAPGPGEVEIEVEAAALNFMDVMKALGIYPGMQELALGGECSGRVVAVGPGVTSVRAGEPVIALAPATLASHVIADARLVRARPDCLSAAQGASVASVYMTAWHALSELARLKAGEWVLVHTASGGFGLAALQLLRRAGARVIATAGSEAKRAYLRELGVEHVFDSRSLGFVQGVLEATNGRGVDVVLNTLSGAAVEASLSVLAPCGRFIELGKTDVYSERGLSLSYFRRALTYSAVDLASLGERDPLAMGRLLDEVLALLASGEVEPLPVEVFAAADAGAAFERMARAEHIGKLVLQLGAAEVDVVAPRGAGIAASSAGIAAAEGSYVVTGGLGGLGLRLGQWLLSQGAPNLVLIGRNAPTPEQRAALHELGLGDDPRVSIERADVCDRAQLSAALSRAPRPILGVFHLSAVLDDGIVTRQNAQRLARVLAPKVQGAVHLHELTLGEPLRHFVTYSSGASLLGSPGQSNYAAANAFLDALAHHRRGEGLPALSVNWGAFGGAGLAAAAGVDTLAGTRGFDSFTPEQSHAALQHLLEHDVAQVAVLRWNFRQWLDFFPERAGQRLIARLLDAEEQPSVVRTDLKDRIAALAAPAARACVEEFVRSAVAAVLRADPNRLDPRAPLESMGLDSLMSLELRNRFEAGTGLRLSATLLWTYPHIEALTGHLGSLLAIDDAPVERAPAAPARDPSSLIEDLDDEQLTSFLDDALDSIEANQVN